MKFRIAHISPPGSKNNESYQNYNKEKIQNGTMLWDDSKENTLVAGDFMIFYCWGEKVEIHKIINFSNDYRKRRAHWEYREHNVLYLSQLLNTYSFKDFADKFKPPYPEYKKGCRNNKSYELNKWPKLEAELNNNPKYNISIEAITTKGQPIENENMTAKTAKIKLVIVDDDDAVIDDAVIEKPTMIDIENPNLDLDEEERNALNILEEIRKKRAIREAQAKIAELRQKKCNKITEIERELRQRENRLREKLRKVRDEWEAYNKGEKDDELIESELKNYNCK